jgi:beta-lactamase regulating signal transducer with metallopeptidase domain
MMERLFYTVLEISVSASAVVLLVFFLTPLLKKRFTAKWRYWIWLVLAVRLLIPANFHMPQPAVQIQMPLKTIAMQNVPAVPSVTKTVSPTPAQQTSRGSDRQSFTVSQLLAVIWISGAAIFLLSRFSAYFVFLRAIRRWSSPVEDAETLEVMQSEKLELGIRRNLIFLRNKKISSPMMTGFFRSALLLPEASYTVEELQLILKHELIHWKRRDIWYKFLISIANAVHWFNPIIWLMARRAGEDTELVCDSEVVKGFGTDSRRRYGETILSSVRQSKIRGTSFSTYFYGGADTLKQRFSNILDSGKKHRGIVAFCAVLIVLCALGAAVACNSEALPNASATSSLTSSHFSEGMRKIRTSDYEITVPSSWVSRQNGSAPLTFLEKGREIGWIDILNYDSSQPISQLQGNHAETLRTKKLGGLKYPAEEVIIRRTPPAAASDQSFTDELHIYILQDGSRIAYDISFDSSRIKEGTALQIAESFRLIRETKVSGSGVDSAYEDINVTNQTVCGNFGTVVCGALKSDPKQGVAVVIWNSGASTQRYLTPEKHGAITSTGNGAKDDVIGVVAEDGYTWIFNMYNGFGQGHQSQSGTESVQKSPSSFSAGQNTGEWIVYEKKGEAGHKLHIKKKDGSEDRIIATDYDEAPCLAGEWVYYFADLNTIRKVKLDGSQKTTVCNTDALGNINGSTEITMEYKNGYIIIKTFQLKSVGDTGPSATPHYYKLDLNQNKITSVKN